MILILHDTLDGYPFIAERLTRPCKKIYSPQKSRKYLTWIAGAWKVMRESRKGDVIVIRFSRYIVSFDWLFDISSTSYTWIKFVVKR